MFGLFKPNIYKLQTRRDVQGLIKALKYEDKYVRKASVEALAWIGDPRSIEPLISALKDSDSDVREAAAEAMRKFADARVVMPLIAALKDPNEDVRWRATEALGTIQDARAVESLIAALKDVVEYIPARAARALEEIGAPAIEPLIVALKDADRNVRRHAAQVLGNLKAARAVEPLIVTLKDSDSDVRWDAVIALGKIGGTCAMEALIMALDDVNERVRGKAVDELCRIGSPVVESVILALKDGSSYCPGAAALLDRLGWQPGQDESGSCYWISKQKWEKCMEIGTLAVEPLIAALKDERFSFVRSKAAEVLGKIGDARALEPLNAALKDNESDVRQAAATALGKLGTPAVEALIAALEDNDSDVRYAAADALERIGWQPGQDKNGAAYWIAKREWNKCIEIGVPAVGPLIATLNATLGAPDVKPLRYTPNALSRGDYERRAMAETLVILYRSGQLDDISKNLILQQREKIILPYTCHSDHDDSPPGCNIGFHEDGAKPVAGIEFPL